MKKIEWKDNLKIGDIVKVKEDVMCPDYKDLTISGWQGTVTEILKEEDDDDDNILICVKWGLETIQNMPDDFVEQGEEDGLDNDLMYLSFEDVELIKNTTKYMLSKA